MTDLTIPLVESLKGQLSGLNGPYADSAPSGAAYPYWVYRVAPLPSPRRFMDGDQHDFPSVTFIVYGTQDQEATVRAAQSAVEHWCLNGGITPLRGSVLRRTVTESTYSQAGVSQDNKSVVRAQSTIRFQIERRV